MKRDVIIDVDTGTDDAIAILLAVKSNFFNIKGITTVGGNIDVENATLNTLKILKLADAEEIPVYKGSAKPICKKKFTFTSSMKPDGLAGLSNKLPKVDEKISKESAVEFIIQTLRNTKNKIDIICLAPLTNIAKSINNLIGLESKINCLYIMGGTIKEKGNVKTNIEFNFYNDPKAVSIVLKSGIPIVLIPLDVTKKLLIKSNWITKKYKKTKDKITKFIIDVVNKEKEITGKDGFYLHDPLALGVAINKKFVNTKTEKLDIITRGENSGQIFKTNEGYKVNYAFKVRKREFINYFQKKLLK